MTSLASDNGFEAEDAARQARLDQNALNSQYERALTEWEALACLLWNQGKYRGLRNGNDFVNCMVSDLREVAREYAIDGVLPEQGRRP